MLINLKEFSVAKVVAALTDPGNRHETRVKHSCDDEKLFLHPDWLLANFETSGRGKQWTDENYYKRFRDHQTLAQEE